MGEMTVEVGVKESSKRKLVRSMWAGHVEKTGDETLAKKVDAQIVDGDCIKNDLKRVGEEWGK